MSSRAQLLFEQIKEGDPLANIKAMVQEQRQESEFLEFKNRSPEETRNKDNWAQVLSAFANTEGGVVIWGVDARAPRDGRPKIDAAQELKPFKDPALFKESLRNWHRDITTDPVTGVLFEEVSEADGTGYVVCYVPEGDNKPYRDMRSNQYYQRVQDNSVVISHPLLRSLFYPRAAAKMELTVAWAKPERFVCVVRNTGVATASDFEFMSVARLNSRLENRKPRPLSPIQIHPGQSWEFYAGEWDWDNRFQGAEVYFAFYMTNHEPQCFRLFLQEMFPAEMRVKSEGFHIQSVSYSEFSQFMSGQDGQAVLVQAIERKIT